jgi:hemerythrin HHE cation binding domain-containing protein
MAGRDAEIARNPRERAGHWGVAGGLAVADRPLAPPGRGEPETFYGRQYWFALLRAHDWLREELGQIRAIGAQVAAGQVLAADARALINGFTLAQHSWNLAEFCATYCSVLESHHQREDIEMFAAVVDVQPDLDDVVTRLRAEHAVIASVLKRMDRILVRIMGEESGWANARSTGVSAATAGTRTAIEEVNAATTELSELLLSHLAYEEDELRHGLGCMPHPG